MADGALDTNPDCVFHTSYDHTSLHQTHVVEHSPVVLSSSDVEGDRNDGEPTSKRLKSDDDGYTETITIDWNDDNVKQTLFNVNRALSLRLDEMENKYNLLLKSVQNLSKKLQARDEKISNRGRGSAVVVGLPQPGGATPKQAFTAPGGNVTLITLNSEDDYPSGVWLGDENNPEMRVRTAITPSDLLHIHSNCRTPEKMALTLLDYLFDRDTQATSNLSGTGKHGKKQLDPLKIYGIRCHLIHRFGITEQDWHRIRLNIDSKCRTAYRRKIRGQPMGVKAFRMSRDEPSFHIQSFSSVTANDLSDDSQLHIQEGLSLDGPGELQIIQATEEQIVQLQQTGQVQFLEDNQVPAELLHQLHHQANNGETVQITVVPTSQSVSVSDVDLDDAASQLQTTVNGNDIGDGHLRDGHLRDGHLRDGHLRDNL